MQIIKPHQDLEMTSDSVKNFQIFQSHILMNNNNKLFFFIAYKFDGIQMKI